MTDIQSDMVFEEESDPSVEPIVYALFPDGTPLFFINNSEQVDEAAELAAGMGEQVFYLLGQSSDWEGNGTNRHQVFKPRIFKASTTILGFGMDEVNTGDLNLPELSSTARFDLPKIPWALIAEVEKFFREVARRFNTESIVLLTYDPTYKGAENESDGWGYVVPEQTNTIAHCEYDPSSYLDEAPEHVILVGSIHSHPNMSAFASNVDEGDQLSFNGIHITCGWLTNNANADWHCELQWFSTRWKVKADELFLDRPEADEALEARVARVKKANFPQTGPANHSTLPTTLMPGSRTSGSGLPAPSAISSRSGPDHVAALAAQITAEQRKRFKNLPEGFPPPSEATVVVKSFLGFADLKECPCCETKLSIEVKNKVRCSNCMCFLMWSGLTYDAFVARRITSNLAADEIDIDKLPSKSVYIWTIKLEDDGTISHSLHQEYTPNVAELAKKAEGGETDFLDDLSADISVDCRTCGSVNHKEWVSCWACGTDLVVRSDFPIPTAGDVFVNQRLLPGPNNMICCDEYEKDCVCSEVDSANFDEVDEYVQTMSGHLRLTIYDKDAVCSRCAFQYAGDCQPYRAYLKEYLQTEKYSEVEDEHSAPEPIDGCEMFSSMYEIEGMISDSERF